METRKYHIGINTCEHLHVNFGRSGFWVRRNSGKCDACKKKRFSAVDLHCKWRQANGR